MYFCTELDMRTNYLHKATTMNKCKHMLHLEG